VFLPSERWSVSCKSRRVRLALVAVSSVLTLAACDFDDMKFDFDLASDSGTTTSKSNCNSDSDCEPGQCCSGFWTRRCLALDPPDASDTQCGFLTADPDAEGPAMCVCAPPSNVATCPASSWASGEEMPTCPNKPYLRCKVSCPNSCVCETFDSGQVPDDGIDVPTCPPDWSATCPDAG